MILWYSNKSDRPPDPPPLSCLVTVWSPRSSFIHMHIHIGHGLQQPPPPPFFCQVDRKALLNISKIYGSKMPVISSKISKYCFVSIFFNEGKSINGKIFNYFLSLVSELLQEKIRANFDESPKSKIVLDVGNSTYTMEI